MRPGAALQHDITPAPRPRLAGAAHNPQNIFLVFLGHRVAWKAQLKMHWASSAITPNPLLKGAAHQLTKKLERCENKSHI